MSEEIDIDTIIEELEQENEDNVEDRHAEVIEEAEGKAEREDKVAHKITKSYEELDKKMDRIELQRVLEKFDESSDETEKLILDTVRADLKDPGKAAEAIKMVRERAAELKKKQEEREAALMQQAEEKAAQAWGVGPLGKPAAPADAEKEIMERINAGGPDSARALAEALLADTPF